MKPDLKRLAGGVASLALAFLLSGCGGSVELLASMNEREANEIVGVLSEAGIPARKVAGKEGAVSLNVEPSQVARAIGVLAAEGLPRERRANMGDVFRKEGLISSPLEERARYLWALSQELSETISQIDGVLRARVHVVLPERSTGGDPPLPSSAGVFVKHRRGVNLEESVPSIKRLVASSIPGLSVDKVSVVLVATTSVAQLPAASSKVPAATQPPALVAAYVLAALSVLCLAGFGAWRVIAKRRAEASGAGEVAA